MPGSRLLFLGFVLLAFAGCRQKEKEGPPPGIKTGDGKSKTGPLALGSAPVQGVIDCKVPTWFVLLQPLKDGGTAHMELKVKPGMPQLCFHLNTYNAKFALLDATISTCDDDPSNWIQSEGAIYGNEAMFLSLDANDPAQCAAAEFKLSVTAAKK